MGEREEEGRSKRWKEKNGEGQKGRVSGRIENGDREKRLEAERR